MPNPNRHESSAEANVLVAAFSRDCDYELRWQLARIHHCLKQLSEEQVWWRPADDMNSIGNLVLHVSGNLTQWVTHGVGGTPDLRDRPTEFTADRTKTIEQLRQIVDTSVEEALVAVNQASAAQLATTKHVQVREVTGIGSVLHSLMHFYGHTQEIVCLTRMQLGSSYVLHHVIA